MQVAAKLYRRTYFLECLRYLEALSPLVPPTKQKAVVDPVNQPLRSTPYSSLHGVFVIVRVSVDRFIVIAGIEAIR